MFRLAQLLGVTAALASMPALAQSTPHWTGFYAGAHAGFARTSSGFDASELARAGFTSPLTIHGLRANGPAFGLTGGYNTQIGSLVLGVEADWAQTAVRGDTAFAANIPPYGSVTGTLLSELDWLTTLRLRAGLTAGRALIFGTAGLAVAGASGELIAHGGGSTFTWTDRALLAGFAYGGGVEHAITSSWSVKAEFIHTILSDGLFSSATENVPVSGRIDVYNLRAGLNFRF